MAPMTHRLITRTDHAEPALERWQVEHRTLREYEEAGFGDDEDVPAILGDMEGEVRMEDLRRVVCNGRVQYESHYDRERPLRAAPADVPLAQGGDFASFIADAASEIGDDE